MMRCLQQEGRLVRACRELGTDTVTPPLDLPSLSDGAWQMRRSILTMRVEWRVERQTQSMLKPIHSR